MFLKWGTNKAIPIALRLTLWYAGIFTISSLIAFNIFYFSIEKIIQGHIDANLVEDIASDGTGKVFFRIIGADAKTLLATDLSAWFDLPPADSVRDLIPEKTGFSLKTVSIDGQQHSARIITAFISGDNIIQMDESLEESNEFLMAFRNVFVVTVPLIIIITHNLRCPLARIRGIAEATLLNDSTVNDFKEWNTITYISGALI